MRIIVRNASELELKLRVLSFAPTLEDNVNSPLGLLKLD